MRGWLGATVLAAAVAAVAARPAPVAAVAEGPEPGFTGGFGEPTCTACHFDSPAEPEEGALVLEGVPERYEPGDEYLIRVVVQDPRLERAGFQLTSRFAEGAGEGRQAGGLSTEGERVEVVEHGEPPVFYARQTLEGARPVPSHEASWTIRWTAPQPGAAPVAFHATANAANHDDSELGDVIHAVSVVVPPAP